MPKIIQVDKGDFLAFAYEGDWPSSVPAPTHTMLPKEPLSPRDFVASWRPSCDVLLLLIAWYVTEAHAPVFLDVGSNIGTDAIRAAKLSRLMRHPFPIVAFEPGVNAALLPYTLRLNGVADLIVFEELAVSDRTEPMILFGEVGKSVNNRVVNRAPDTEAFCKLVDGTTLDDYFAKSPHRDRHPVVKIDTQGAEWFIWRGAQVAFANRQPALVMEFTPWALRSSVEPAAFLRELLGRFHLFDLGYARDRFLPITPGDVPAAVNRIGEPPCWSDLLCVSRSLPSAHRLMERIATAYY